MSGVAEQFATQLGEKATQKYVGVAVFSMKIIAWPMHGCETAAQFVSVKLFIGAEYIYHVRNMRYFS